MLLEPGERVLRQDLARQILPDGRRRGMLVLTDRRLAFEERSPGGLLNPGVVAFSLDAALSSVVNASVSTEFVRSPKLVVQTSSGLSTFKTADPMRWVEAIAAARHRQRTHPTGPGIGASAPGGAGHGPAHPLGPAVLIRCRYCGRLEPPTATRCPGCGSLL